MQRRFPLAAIAPVVIAGAVALAAGPALAQSRLGVADGQELYAGKCGGCHSLDENRVGPRHRDLVGRKVASLADYDYSRAIKKLGGVWTSSRLDQWLQGPQTMAPGAKMFFQVPDPAQRKAIITYLSANSRQPG
jgi:cytochrome c